MFAHLHKPWFHISRYIIMFLYIFIVLANIYIITFDNYNVYICIYIISVCRKNDRNGTYSSIIFKTSFKYISTEIIPTTPSFRWIRVYSTLFWKFSLCQIFYWPAYCWQIKCGLVSPKERKWSPYRGGLVVTSRHEKPIIDKIMHLTWTSLSLSSSNLHMTTFRY